MTVAAMSETRVQIQGDGATDRVDLPFQFVDQNDLKVIHTDAGGSDTEWIYQQAPGSWSFSGGNYATGTVHFIATALAAGERLTVTLTSTYDQPFTLEGGEIDPAVIQRAMDRTALQVQAIAGRASRSLSVSPSLAGALPSLEVPDLPDGYGFVRSGDALIPALIDSAAISTAVAATQAAQTGAETAEVGAVAAQGAAQTAQTGAETAQAAAVVAQGAAEAAKTGAETAKTGAEQAAADAVTNATAVLGYGRIPVGTMMPWPSGKAPNSFWVLITQPNQVYNRATFPQLHDVLAPEFAVVITNGSAVVTGVGSADFVAAGMAVEGAGIPAGTTILSVDGTSQITLSANATANGVAARVFYHGNGDGATTSNFPNTAGRVPRGLDASGTINPDGSGGIETQEDAFQNITGSWESNVSRLDHVIGGAVTGAFQGINKNLGNYVSSNAAGATSIAGLSFDASRVARTADETRAKAFITPFIIKVAGGVDDVATLTAIQIVQDVATVLAKATETERISKNRVQTLLTAASSWAIAAGGATEISALNTTIDNVAASSSVKVSITLQGEADENIMYNVKRNGAVVTIGDAAGSRPRGTFLEFFDGAERNSTATIKTFIFEDTSPDVGSNTYTIEAGCAAAKTAYVNRTITDTDGNNFERMVSVVLLEEKA